MKFFYVILMVAALALTGCSDGGDDGGSSGAGNLEFNITGAKALAGGSDSSSSGSSRLARTEMSSDLMKILEDGTIETALSFGSDSSWAPGIAFMSVGDDGSVYICFEHMYTTWENDSETGIQFVRVYPDNHYDVLWPIDPQNFSWESQVSVWSWYGQDSAPLVKDTYGNIYFKSDEWSGSSQSSDIWKYSPSTGGTPTRVTPANGDMSIESFKVDSQSNVYIKSNGWDGGASWLRCYPVGSAAFTNIYYSSSSDIWVNGFEASSTGSSVIINGDNIRGMSGIMKADISQGSDPVINLLYGNSNVGWIQLYKNSTDSWTSSTALIEYNSSTLTYSWLSEVTDGSGNPDINKVKNRIQGYYAGDIITLTDTITGNTDLNIASDESGGVSLGQWIRNDGEAFLNTTFTGDLMSEWLTANGLTDFYLGNIASMFYDDSDNLYGYYGSGYYMGMDSSGDKIVKLLDSNGERDLQVIEGNHGDEKPSKAKFVGDYMYYRYAVMSGGYETGMHKLARLNYKTGVEDEILVDSFFSGKQLEILSYDVDDNNTMLYFSALNAMTNEVIFGKINLNSSMSYSAIDYGSAFSNITVF